MFVSLLIVVWDLRDWTPERCNNYTFERVAQNIRTQATFAFQRFMQLHHKTDSPVKRHDPAADCSQTNIGSYLTVFNIFFYALLKQSSIANLPESGARALYLKEWHTMEKFRLCA